MLFSLSFTVVLFITLGVNGQNNDLKKGYPFGKLRMGEDGKNEELIPSNDAGKSQINQDQSSGMQPLPSPCVGASPSAKLAYPKEKTKYIQCRDQFHYEIFTCPNGGDYNEQTNSCDLTIPMMNKCDQEKPCLNDGQCILLSNSSFKCVCRADWTGDRCDTPINSCVEKPCGPNAECRPLDTIDYEQDYVCVCNGKRNYGLNCQEVVPNPCLTMTEQFFPYAFSQRAYIQCDGEMVYFQPCGPSLYWNQEDKICDRKRPAQIDLPTLTTKYAANKNENQQEVISTTTEQMEQQNQNENDNEAVLAFIPARVANREQFQTNVNNQQDRFGQNGRENAEKRQESSLEFNQGRQDGMSRAKQWPNHQTESTLRQPPTIQSGQNQPWSQNMQQQWTPTSTESSSMNSNMAQMNIKQNNQQQNFGQQDQAFGSQQWSNQMSDKNTQNNQRSGSSSQSWQGSQKIQNQPSFQSQNVPPAFETTTTAQNTGFRSEQSRQNRPNNQLNTNQSPQSLGFSLQTPQNFVSQPQSWQSSQTFQNRPQAIETTTVAQQIARPSGSQNFNTQFSGSQSTQPGGVVQQTSQSFDSQPQSWQGSQTNQDQAPFQNQNQQSFLGTTTVPSNVNRFQNSQNWNSQSNGNRSPQSTTFNSENFASQPQSWQNSQTMQNEQQFQKRNQQMFTETSTSAQNTVRPEGLQTSNTLSSSNQSPKLVKFSPKQHSWQNAQLSENQQNFIPNNLDGLSVDNKDRLNTGIQQNNQMSFEQQIMQNQPLGQNQGDNQIRQKFAQSESSFNDVQRPSSNNEQPSAGQPVLNQQWSSNSNLQNGQLQKGFQSQNNQQNFPQQNQAFGFNQGLNEVSEVNKQNNQRFGSSSQSWQGSQTSQNQPQFQNQNQQSFLETSTIPQNVNLFQGQQNQNTPTQDQSWSKQQDTTQVFAFRPKQRQDTSMLSSNMQNTQSGFNPAQSWSNNQQFQQENQPSDSDDSQNFAVRPQNGQMTGTTFETTTKSNKGISQGFIMQGSPNWQSNRPVESAQQNTNEQRATPGTLSNLQSGSWKSRS